MDLRTKYTINNNKRNTSLLPLPTNFESVIHMDILFGSKITISGIKYALFIVNKATRDRFILPLKNLTTDILYKLNKSVTSLGLYPNTL